VRRWAIQNSARLKLVNPPTCCQSLLEATHLNSVFEVSSLKDAISILQPAQCASRLAIA
jgi:hypothetical protein